MARGKTAGGQSHGPYLAAAVYCHTIVTDSEGQATPAGIFDTLNLLIPASTPLDFPSEEKRIQLPIWAFISFRTGDAPGDHDFYIVSESPSGKKTKQEERTIKLSEPPQGGFNLNLKINFGIVKGGLFWTNVYIDNQLMARMPLLINLTREGEPKAADVATDAVQNKDKKGKLRKQ